MKRKRFRLSRAFICSFGYSGKHSSVCSSAASIEILSCAQELAAEITQLVKQRDELEAELKKVCKTLLLIDLSL